MAKWLHKIFRKKVSPDHAKQAPVIVPPPPANYGQREEPRGCSCLSKNKKRSNDVDAQRFIYLVVRLQARVRGKLVRRSRVGQQVQRRIGEMLEQRRLRMLEEGWQVPRNKPTWRNTDKAMLLRRRVEQYVARYSSRPRIRSRRLSTASNGSVTLDQVLSISKSVTESTKVGGLEGGIESIGGDGFGETHPKPLLGLHLRPSKKKDGKIHVRRISSASAGMKVRTKAQETEGQQGAGGVEAAAGGGGGAIPNAGGGNGKSQSGGKLGTANGSGVGGGAGGARTRKKRNRPIGGRSLKPGTGGGGVLLVKSKTFDTGPGVQRKVLRRVLTSDLPLDGRVLVLKLGVPKRVSAPGPAPGFVPSPGMSKSTDSLESLSGTRGTGGPSVVGGAGSGTTTKAGRKKAAAAAAAVTGPVAGTGGVPAGQTRRGGSAAASVTSGAISGVTGGTVVAGTAVKGVAVSASGSTTTVSSSSSVDKNTNTTSSSSSGGEGSPSDHHQRKEDETGLPTKDSHADSDLAATSSSNIPASLFSSVKDDQNDRDSSANSSTSGRRKQGAPNGLLSSVRLRRKSTPARLRVGENGAVDGSSAAMTHSSVESDAISAPSPRRMSDSATSSSVRSMPMGRLGSPTRDFHDIGLSGESMVKRSSGPFSPSPRLKSSPTTVKARTPGTRQSASSMPGRDPSPAAGSEADKSGSVMGERDGGGVQHRRLSNGNSSGHARQTAAGSAKPFRESLSVDVKDNSNSVTPASKVLGRNLPDKYANNYNRSSNSSFSPSSSSSLSNAGTNHHPAAASSSSTSSKGSAVSVSAHAMSPSWRSGNASATSSTAGTPRTGVPSSPSPRSPRPLVMESTARSSTGSSSMRVSRDHTPTSGQWETKEMPRFMLKTQSFLAKEKSGAAAVGGAGAVGGGSVGGSHSTAHLSQQQQQQQQPQAPSAQQPQTPSAQPHPQPQSQAQAQLQLQPQPQLPQQSPTPHQQSPQQQEQQPLVAVAVQE